MTEEIQIGEYCFATKWSDGDPGDPWGFGFYHGEQNGRHAIIGNDGMLIRPGGYRRVAKSDCAVGALLLEHAAWLESTPPGAINLWDIIDKLTAPDEKTLRILVGQAVESHALKMNAE